MSTERRNQRSCAIDQMETLEILRTISREDRGVAEAVATCLPEIGRAVDRIAVGLAQGGRLIYAGAGTSGRLAVLDAVECPPTFGVEPERVQAILAGGPEALLRAVEGAEDSCRAAAQDVEGLRLGSTDSLVGLAASGRTPYTCEAVHCARQKGAFTVGVSCSPGTPLGQAAELAIEVDTGPEVIAGSTRMKAGTAQKMILNMLSTAVMIKLGCVHDNLMVNVQLTNDKLLRRGIGIVQTLTGCTEEQASEAVRASLDVKTASIMVYHGIKESQARRLLAEAGSLRAALAEYEKNER